MTAGAREQNITKKVRNFELIWTFSDDFRFHGLVPMHTPLRPSASSGQRHEKIIPANHNDS